MSQPKNLMFFAENNSLRNVLKAIRSFARKVDKRKKPFNIKALRDTGGFYADSINLPF